MKKALIKMLALCYGAVLISGCATTGGKALYYNEAAKAPDIVAILPPEDETTDMAAADTFQRVMATVMVALGYLPVVSPSQEDSLRQMGISDGGQLKAFKPRDISKKLGSDGLLYGNVSEFKDLNVGLYRERRVDFSGYLADASGAKAWESEGRSVSKKFTLSLDAVTQSFAEGLAQKMLQRILNIHLLEEASVAGVYMMQKIPEWPEIEKSKAAAIKRDIK